MQSLITILQLIVSILLIAVITMQRSDKGLDGAFGGSDTDSGVKFKRRGAEKFFYEASIILAIALVGLSIATLILI